MNISLSSAKWLLLWISLNVSPSKFLLEYVIRKMFASPEYSYASFSRKLRADFHSAIQWLFLTKYFQDF
jgi:hypothetical protein